MGLNYFGHHGIRVPIEVAVQQLGRIDEELVDLHAQSVGQPMERLWVGLVATAKNAADRPLIQAGLLGHPADRPSPGSHQTQQVFAGVIRHTGP